jgi:hypothetical protein
LDFATCDAFFIAYNRAMAYEGEILSECPSDIDFAACWAVVVSGAKWNPCGHMMFSCGSNSENSWYFHVAGQGIKEAMGVYGFPKFMRGDRNYYRYLTDNGKREIRRLDARLTNPAGAYQKLMSLMADKWFWGVLWNNCAVFAKDIIVAGGGSVEILLNCPDKEFAQKADKAIDAAAKGIIESLPYGLGGF